MIDSNTDSNLPGRAVAMLSELAGQCNAPRLTDHQINLKFRKFQKTKTFKKLMNLSWREQIEGGLRYFNMQWPSAAAFAIYSDEIERQQNPKAMSLILYTEDEHGTKRQEFHEGWDPLFLQMPAMISSCRKRLILTNQNSFDEDNPWYNGDDEIQDDELDTSEQEMLLSYLKERYEKTRAKSV